MCITFWHHLSKTFSFSDFYLNFFLSLLFLFFLSFMILCVAEKPSVAKTITNLLTPSFTKLSSTCKYTPNYKFTHNNTQYIFTSVLGHLYNIDFANSDYWTLENAFSLFEAEIVNIATNIDVKNNLITLMTKNRFQKLIIFTDNDREGESIGYEIMQTCCINQNLVVKRAKFHALTYAEIVYSLENLCDLHMNSVFAVKCRSELDLRIGSSLTRLLTLSLSKKVVSFGSCQMPTLGFVAARYFDILEFVPEPFYELQITVKKFVPCLCITCINLHHNVIKSTKISKNTPQADKIHQNATRGQKITNFKNYDGDLLEDNFHNSNALLGDNVKDPTVVGDIFEVRKTTKNKAEANLNISEIQNTEKCIQTKHKPTKELKTVFKHNRGALFDKNLAIHFYNILKSSSLRISSVIKKPATKYKPLPLRTVELIKSCARNFRFSSHKTMSIAEKLYNSGYISYPRTETDMFAGNFDFKSTIKHCTSNHFVDYYQNFKFKHPRNGKNNDHAHLPIYVLKPGNDLKNDEKRVYEYICRRFLACVSDNASGLETIIEICAENNVFKEYFKASGLKILAKNYLDVYTYDKWDEKEIIDIDYTTKLILTNKKICGNELPAVLDIHQGTTTCPEYLTEPQLINLMDKNCIGTDATIAEHIKKIIDREYIYTQNKYLIPTDLGINLIRSFNEINLQSLVKPFFRAEFEKSLKKICEGSVNYEDVLKNEIEFYKSVFETISRNIEVFKKHIGVNNSDVSQNNINKRNDNYGDDSDSSSGSGHRNRPKFYDINTVQSNKKESSNKKSTKTTKKQKDDRKTAKKQKEVTNNNKKPLENTKSTRQVSLEKCDCGLVVIEKLSRQGKTFYSCCDWPNGCQYIRFQDQRNFTKNAEKCDCGYETVEKVCKTGENAGKSYMKCCKAYKPCKYFQWIT